MARLLTRAHSVLPVFDLFQAHAGIVIRHAAGGIGHTASNEHISFRPMDLQIAGRDGRQKDTPFESADFVGQSDPVILPQVQFHRVGRIHQDGITLGAVERIVLGINQGIELLAPAC